MDLICPKCQGAMRSYERNGVTVDQCSECRGIFLDRGELEKLIDAETSWTAQTAQQAPQSQPVAQSSPQGAPQRVEEHGHQDYDRQREGSYAPRKKRKKSFLEDLFE